jgi:two-component system, NarL family, sensor kinase
MYKIIATVNCLLFVMYCSFAQADKVDKIKAIKDDLTQAKNLFTTNKPKGEQLANKVLKDAATFKETLNEYIDAHNLLGLFATYKDEPEKAMKFYNDGLKLALTNNNKSLAQKLQTNIGNHYMRIGKYNDAIVFITNLLKDIKDNKSATAHSLANIAVCYSYLEEDSMAILYQKQAIVLFNELNDNRGLSTGYNLLGVSYTSLKKYEIANDYLTQSLKIKQQLKDTEASITALTNIGVNYFKLNDLPNSIQVLKQAEQYLMNYKSNQSSVSVYTNIGTYYDKVKNYDSANYYNYKALQYVVNTKNLYLHANLLRNMSRMYDKLNNSDSALAYLLKANVLFDSLKNIEKLKQVKELSTKYETEKKQLQINLLAKQDSLKGLTIVQQQLAITNVVLKIANQNLALSKASNQLTADSLQLAYQQKQLLSSQLQTQQQQEKITLLNKEKQIQTLAVKNKNYAIAGIATTLVLLSFAGIGYFRNYKLQQQKIVQAKLHQQQQQATIAILTAEEKERKRIAGDLHDGIGQTMMAAWLNLQAIQNNTATALEKEQLLQKAMLLVDESCKDVRAVSHNMMPNALLKKGLVNAVKEFIQQIDEKVITINVHSEGLNKELPAVTETILYRVIQESVNNVVKHAQATLLDISILNEADGIDVLIEDNGKGFNVAQALQQQGGLGLNNIKSRIEYLKGTVEWSSNANSGTLVAIHIPV